MKSLTLLFTLYAALTLAQNCINPGDPLPDPLVPFGPGQVTSQCDTFGDVPHGPIPSGCAELEIIYARGTGEPGPLGMVVGDPVVARVKRDLPTHTVHGYPVQYPARLIGGAPFTDDGMKDVKARLASQSVACPNTKFVLSGYSQGGVVMQFVLLDLAQTYQSKIIAIVLYASTDAALVPASWKPKTLANCAPGDFACPDSGSGAGHVSYNNQGTVWHDRTAQYIEAAFFGTPYGYRLLRSPTAPLT